MADTTTRTATITVDGKTFETPVYDGSWVEWGVKDNGLPVATGPATSGPTGKAEKGPASRDPV